MKRDLDLCTKILIKLDEKGINDLVSEMDGYSKDEFNYNARLLKNAGLIEIRNLAAVGDAYGCAATELTWAGHDFLEKAKSPEWIAHIKEHGTDVGKDIASAGIRAALAKLGDAIAPYLSNIF